jgi:hypothetical protein
MNNELDQRVADAVANARYEDRARAIVAEGQKLSGFREAARTLDTVGLDNREFLEEVVAASGNAEPPRAAVSIRRNRL